MESQIPSTFTNLQVLPSDISRDALVSRMRNVAGALGVRCSHCHVGGSANSIEGMDFASDENETKRVARAMFRMVEEINGPLLAATERNPDEMRRVTCFTCHHGVRRPDTTRDVLTRAYERRGVDAVIAAYEGLREEYYGTSAYDFGRGALSSIAERIAEDDAEGAERILDYNAELFPEFDYNHYLLYMLRLQAGDREGARAHLVRALEIAPDSEFYQARLEELDREQD